MFNIKNVSRSAAIGVLLPVLSVSAAVGVYQLSKADEIKLKQDMAHTVAAQERATDRIGIFHNQFETEIEGAKKQYASELGENGYGVVQYEDFTLIVPAKLGDEDINAAKKEVDIQTEAQKNKSPSSDIETSQIAKIREVFDTKGEIIFNDFIGAYTDEAGFQYNFEDGELIGKQVGITSALSKKNKAAYPHLHSANAAVAHRTNEEAKGLAEKVLESRFGSAAEDMSRIGADMIEIDANLVGFAFADNTVQVLIDKVSGDIIHFSMKK